jgi:hypothetical protein
LAPSLDIADAVVFLHRPELAWDAGKVVAAIRGDARIGDFEFDKADKLRFEKEMLGLYISDHPLLGVEAAGRWQEAANEMLGRSTVTPAEVLDAVMLVTEGFVGFSPVNNLFNVLGYYEALTGFGTAGNNESGILWSKVLAASIIFANSPLPSPYGSRIRYRGVTYGLDLSSIPAVPASYRVSANGGSLLDAIGQVCREAGYDFFVTLETLTLKVNVINRTTAATSGAMIMAASPSTSMIGLPLLLRLPPQNAMRKRMSAINPTATTSPNTIVETRMS